MDLSVLEVIAVSWVVIALFVFAAFRVFYRKYSAHVVISPTVMSECIALGGEYYLLSLILSAIVEEVDFSEERKSAICSIFQSRIKGICSHYDKLEEFTVYDDVKGSDYVMECMSTNAFHYVTDPRLFVELIHALMRDTDRGQLELEWEVLNHRLSALRQFSQA